MPESDTLMKEVQKILLGFIECNHDAWAPMIARVIKTMYQICLITRTLLIC